MSQDPCAQIHARRLLLQALTLPLAGLAGCATGLPQAPPGAGSSSALARLQECAAAHGLLAWRGLHDINTGHSRAWPPAALAMTDWDTGAPTQDRLMPGAGLVAVALRSAAGSLQLLRRQAGAVQGLDTASVQLWVNGRPSTDNAALAAAAWLADGQRLLLLGPLALVDTPSVVNWGPPESLDGRRCDQLLLDLIPGLGLSLRDRLALFIDRDLGLLRRLRLSASAPGSATSGVIEVDFFDHLPLHGVLWPRRFQSPARLRLPDAAPQTWRLSALDLDRGYASTAIAGAVFEAQAAAPARAMPAG